MNICQEVASTIEACFIATLGAGENAHLTNVIAGHTIVARILVKEDKDMISVGYVFLLRACRWYANYLGVELTVMHQISASFDKLSPEEPIDFEVKDL